MLSGTVISVGLFSHILGVDDAIIGIMSCMSKILSGFLYAFATTTWMIYLGKLVVCTAPDRGAKLFARIKLEAVDWHAVCLVVLAAPLVDMVNGTSFIAMRSIASKLVPPDELGELSDYTPRSRDIMYLRAQPGPGQGPLEPTDL